MMIAAHQRGIYHWMSTHLKLAWFLTLLWPAVWAFDREPPVRILDQSLQLKVRPGESAVFSASVQRNLRRQCSTRYSKHLLDAAGVEHDILASQTISYKTMLDMEHRMGPWFRIGVTIPPALPAGRATLFVDEEYVCNPLHYLFPIRSTTTFTFTVLDATFNRSGHD